MQTYSCHMLMFVSVFTSVLPYILPYIHFQLKFLHVQLTQLMSDSLGGNAKTLCFVCISPVDINLDETQSSLTYAARMKLITNSAEKMQETAQVAKLKSIIAQLRAGNNPAFVDIEEEGDVETDGQSSPASSTAAEDQDDADASATPSSVVTGGDATPSSESVVAGDGDNESSAP